MELSDLKKIGLTKGEVKVYDALLELGETTRTELAKKSGISPSKIYDVANRLLEKGIISCVKKQGVLHFSAADPDRLRDYVEKKHSEIENEMQLIQKILPTLQLKYRKTEESVDIEVFYGWEGMTTVFRDLAMSLTRGDVNCIFGASMGRDSKQADIFFRHYEHNLVDKRGYKIKILFNEDVRGYKDRTDYFEKSPIHEVRYLHQKTFTELNFYKGTVLFIFLLKRPMVIRIKSKEAADSCRKFFDTLWKTAKP